MTWTGWTDHALRLSTGVYARELFTVDTRANARLVPAPDGTLFGIQTPEVRDFTDAEKIFPEDTQIVVFGSLLEEWRIARDWTLTSGVRVDDYSAGSLTATCLFSVAASSPFPPKVRAWRVIGSFSSKPASRSSNRASRASSPIRIKTSTVYCISYRGKLRNVSIISSASVTRP